MCVQLDLLSTSAVTPALKLSLLRIQLVLVTKYMIKIPNLAYVLIHYPMTLAQTVWLATLLISGSKQLSNA